MIVGVIGSGSIGPDLAYGFVTALAAEPGSRVYLVDVKQDALDAGVARIKGYVSKALARGKLSPKVAQAVEAALVPTLKMSDLHDCEYVLEAGRYKLRDGKLHVGGGNLTIRGAGIAACCSSVSRRGSRRSSSGRSSPATRSTSARPCSRRGSAR